MKNQVHHPFGVPDSIHSASIEDIENVGSEGFVHLKILDGFENDHYRIIIGRKGTGKTLYLRRRRRKLIDTSAFKAEDFEILESLDFLRPGTELVVKFSQFFSDSFLVEKWKEVWLFSIYRSIASHFIYNKSLNKYLDTPVEEFKGRFGKILSKAKIPVTIFSQIQELISKVNSSSHYVSLSKNILWYELSEEISRLIKISPPLYCFIDAIDEEFENAPEYWLKCQHGLYYAVMHLQRNIFIGKRLHIIVTLRDLVYTSIRESEHFTRYSNDETVGLLEWDPETTLLFLKKKIEYLEPKYFRIKNSNRTIQSFIGVKNIYNTKRCIEEEAESYIVRHTRNIPRDIVLIGNEICRLNLSADSVMDSDYIECFKLVVKKFAEIFANEQLIITTNQIITNLMPIDAINLGLYDFYMKRIPEKETDDNLKSIFFSKICELICHIGKDRFSHSELTEAKLFARTLFGLKTDLSIFDILWQNRLIGFDKDEDYSQFYSINSRSFKLPKSSTYCFHSILIDFLNIEAIGKPVNIIG